jgi:ribose transport system substrate-binding protein
MKRIFSIVLSLMILSTAVGCSSQQSASSAAAESAAAPASTAAASAASTDAAAGKKYKIALVTKMVDSTYWQTVKKNAEKEAQKLGNVEITHLGPPTEADIDKQVQIIETCISDKYDGIILAACDKDALVEPVKKAKAAGIPVVMIDSGISEDAYDAFLATNNVDAGASCAKLMAKLIGDSGDVAIVNFAAGTQTAVDREKGFTDEIKKNHPKIKIVGVQYCDSDPTKAANQATDFISANPNLKGIWGANDQSAVGVAQAVTEKKLGDKIAVVGFDNSDDIKAGLASGAIKGTAVQMPSVMGSKGVDLVLDLINGKKIDNKNVDTGVTMVTTENYKDAAISAILNQ